MSGEDEAAELHVTEQLLRAQRLSLNDKIFEAFKAWAEAADYGIERWSISEQGILRNPLGDEISIYDATCSLQRIAQIKIEVDPAVMVGCFLYSKNGGQTPEIPCELRKEGQVTIVIWALWDGSKCHGDARAAMPATPSVLVSIEGEGPDEAVWKDPHKVYALMEYGFKLMPFTPTISTGAEPHEEEETDIPF